MEIESENISSLAVIQASHLPRSYISYSFEITIEVPIGSHIEADFLPGNVCAVTRESRKTAYNNINNNGTKYLYYCGTQRVQSGSHWELKIVSGITPTF